MSIFIDANALVALKIENHWAHKKASSAWKEIVLKQKYGRPVITDYVLQEILHGFLESRPGNPRSEICTKRTDLKMEERERLCDELAKEIDRAVQLPMKIDFKPLGTAAFTNAKKYIQEYRDIPLGFIDWTIIAFMEWEGIKYLWSYDRKFDSITKKLNLPKIVRVE